MIQAIAVKDITNSVVMVIKILDIIDNENPGYIITPVVGTLTESDTTTASFDVVLISVNNLAALSGPYVGGIKINGISKRLPIFDRAAPLTRCCPSINFNGRWLPSKTSSSQILAILIGSIGISDKVQRENKQANKTVDQSF